MAELWMTVDDAARKVERSSDTILRWIRHGELRRFPNGKVRTDQLLDLDAQKRKRLGRPKGHRVPLMLEGKEVGAITIAPDGRITGRIATPRR